MALFADNLGEAQQLGTDVKLLLRGCVHVDLKPDVSVLDPEVDDAPLRREVVAFSHGEHAAVLISWKIAARRFRSDELTKTIWQPPICVQIRRVWRTTNGLPCTVLPAHRLVQGVAEGILAHHADRRWDRWRF